MFSFFGKSYKFPRFIKLHYINVIQQRHDTLVSKYENLSIQTNYFRLFFLGESESLFV